MTAEMDNNVKEFYDSLKMGNAVSNQQANALIRLSITAQVTNLVVNGEDPEKIKGLMEILKEIK